MLQYETVLLGLGYKEPHRILTDQLWSNDMPCIAQAAVTSFSLQKPRFAPGAAHLGFVVDKVVAGQASL
jgi:hypothetical protein